MTEITVEALADHEHLVRVRAGGRTTRHRVVVPPELLADLGLVDVPEEQVVRESFRFLLEREPPDAILAEFSLPVIGDYFPGYAAEIRSRLGAGPR